jgi:hypothetical protein
MPVVVSSCVAVLGGVGTAGNIFQNYLKIELASLWPIRYYPSPCRNLVAAAELKIFEILKDLD